MRKKQLIISSFGIVIALAAYFYFFSNSPARLAKETTFITSPLAEDGLPNYALAILERQGNGVTSENNGAPLFWRAVGPGRLDPKSFAAVCDELDVNIAAPPSPPFLIDVASDENVDQLARWIAERNGTLAELGEAANYTLPAKMLDAAKPYLQTIQTRSWSGEQFPPLANWLTENDAALDLLVEASQKPRFFSPSPDFLLDPNTPVFSRSFEHAILALNAVQSLAARSMHRLATEQHEAAWNDALACWQLGQKIGNDRPINELLAGLGIRQSAHRATLSILDSPTLPKELAIQIQTDLASLAPALDVASSVDFYDRVAMLDTMLRHLSGRLGGVEDQSRIKLQYGTGVNLNVALETGNRFYDQLVAALAMSDDEDRFAAIQKPYNELEDRSEKTIGRQIRSILSRKARSEVMGDFYLGLMAPATSALVAAWERDHAYLLLTQVAAALAIYRTEHGEYPPSFEALAANKQLSNIPNDPYVVAPFKYERRGKGYLLYSLYENGVDDGGSDVKQPIVEGEWIETDGDHYSRDFDKSDLVIRLPLPAFEPPSPKDVDDDAN